MVIGLAGSGSFALSGSGALSLIVPFTGSGAFGISGAGDLRGILRMSGGWTPYTELSPQNLAREVWTALAAQYPDSLTMGGKLNTASAGGVDLSALAQAVLDALNLTTIPVNMVQVKGQPISGAGSEADPWGP